MKPSSLPPAPYSTSYKYFAFISYSRKDSKVAAWLQKRLEWFRFPVKLVPDDRRPSHQCYLRPIYRDRTNLEVDDAHYWNNIRQALDQSRFLIVLCSPDSAQSGPVEMEVSHFLQARTQTAPHDEAIDYVLPVILSGRVTNDGKDNCLPISLRRLGPAIIDRNLPSLIPDDETTASEALENGFIGIVSYLLKLSRGVLSDHLRREERRKAHQIRLVAGAMAVLLILAVAGGLMARWSQQEAVRQKELADEQRQVAEQSKETAQKEAARAEREKQSADRQRLFAERSKKSAERIIQQTLYDLRDKLEPIGKLDLLDHVSKIAEDYFADQMEDQRTEETERERAVMLHFRADVLRAQGNIAAALNACRQSLAISQKLAKLAPSNKGWQNDLSISHQKIGDILFSKGDAAAALQSYEDAFAIDQTLAQSAPTNSHWQTSLALAQIKIGDVKLALGDTAAALRAYQDSVTIARKLTLSEPSNLDRHRVLSGTLTKVGDALLAKGGDDDAALLVFTESLNICRKLAESNPSNAEWQHDLFVNQEKVASILLDRSDKGALKAHQDSLAIILRLANLDPSNSGWQRDLAMAYFSLGNAFYVLQNSNAALKAYQDSLILIQKLASSEPANVGRQHDLSIVQEKLGKTLLAAGKTDAGLKAHEDSLTIKHNLAINNPTNSYLQRDLWVSHVKMGAVFEELRDHSKAMDHARMALNILQRMVDQKLEVTPVDLSVLEQLRAELSKK